jgi:hypothetical protein
MSAQAGETYSQNPLNLPSLQDPDHSSASWQGHLPQSACLNLNDIKCNKNNLIKIARHLQCSSSKISHKCESYLRQHVPKKQLECQGMIKARVSIHLNIALDHDEHTVSRDLFDFLHPEVPKPNTSNPTFTLDPQ